MFIYRFHSKLSEHRNRVTVVGVLVDGQLDIAVSRCSKKDHFCRKTGNLIAEGRLRKKVLYDSIPMESCSTREFVDIAMNVAINVSRDPRLIKA
jgi:hypothetical protein